MKPFLTVKKVKGKSYLQFSDLGGNLIHRGPAKDLEVWSLAYLALDDAYSGHVFEEMLALKELADEVGVNILSALDKAGSIIGSQRWRSFSEKRKKAYLKTVFFRQLFEGLKAEDPEFLEGLNRAEVEWEASEKAGETVGVSGDAVRIGSRIHQIYGQIKEHRSGERI